jgi:phage-related protein
MDLEPVYDNNNGTAVISGNSVKVKVHKWPFIKSYEEKSTVLTIEFENIREANMTKNSTEIKIEMHKFNGDIYKTFTSAWLKCEDTGNSTVVIFNTDYWEEKNLIN